MSLNWKYLWQSIGFAISGIYWLLGVLFHWFPLCGKDFGFRSALFVDQFESSRFFFLKKVIDTLTQEDFYGAFQKLLER